MKNGFSNPYHLDEFTIAVSDIKRNITFLFHFSMKNMPANRIAPAFCGVTSGANLFVYVPKKDARLNTQYVYFMFVHYTFSSVWVAEWPPFG